VLWWIFIFQKNGWDFYKKVKQQNQTTQVAKKDVKEEKSKFTETKKLIIEFPNREKEKPKPVELTMLLNSTKSESTNLDKSRRKNIEVKVQNKNKRENIPLPNIVKIEGKYVLETENE
jgi:hypothetical protein